MLKFALKKWILKELWDNFFRFYQIQILYLVDQQCGKVPILRQIYIKSWNKKNTIHFFEKIYLTPTKQNLKFEIKISILSFKNQYKQYFDFWRRNSRFFWRRMLNYNSLGGYFFNIFLENHENDNLQNELKIAY